MAKPIARVGDEVVHGGAIVSGDYKVLSNNLPTARKDDMAVCSRHGIAAVKKVSATVSIGSRGVARVDDACVCEGAAKLGAGMKGAMALALQAFVEGWSEAKLKEELANAAADNEWRYERIVDPNGRGGISLASAKGDVLLTDPTHFALAGQFNAVSGDLAFDLGNGAELGLEGRLGNLDFGADVFVGSNAEQAGIAFRGAAEASAASVGASFTQNTTVGGFIDRLRSLPIAGPIAAGTDLAAAFSSNVAKALETPLAVTVKGSLDAFDAGATLGGEATVDKKTGEGTLGAELGIGVGPGGADLGIELVIGAPDAVPNTITKGSGNISVGG
jgi:uncharacterized Zn-binding protein involved in type VI secretion